MMPRTVIKWDQQGKLVEIVDGEIVWARDDYYQQSGVNAPAVLNDLPDFISPVDGSLVSGRASLREHNRRNNVVNTADLAGMPIRQTVNPISDEYRAETRKTISDVMKARGYK